MIELSEQGSISSSVTENSVPELSIKTPAVSPVSLAGNNQNAQLFILLQQLQDEVRSLRGQLEAQQHKLKQMESEQKGRYRDLDRRISFLMQNDRPTSATVKPPVSTDKLITPPQDDAPTKVVSVEKATVASSVTDQAAYKSAFALVRKRAYDDAVEAFLAFNKRYPESQLLPNSHYWLGEIYLLQQKQDLAKDAFLTVVDGYADHRKAPDATYKLGKVYSELGDTANSTKYIDMVIANYPESSAARLAREFKRQ